MRKTTKRPLISTVRRQLPLKETELSPRELAVTFTDKDRYFVSETTVYRTLKAHDLMTSPAFIVLKAANACEKKTTAINQLWHPKWGEEILAFRRQFTQNHLLNKFPRHQVSQRLMKPECFVALWSFFEH